MSPVNLDDILQLPAPERLELLGKIWESLSATPEEIPLTDAQKAELDRRIDAHEQDPDNVVSADDVKSASADLRLRLRGHE